MNINSARSFDDVRAAVTARADLALPDAVVHVSDLRVTAAGHIRAPGIPTLRLNDWSRRQLSSMLGIRWNTWFSPAVTGEERADEINRRLARTPGEKKLRADRDPTGEADGVARAILGPAFTPIDDTRVFDRLATNLGSSLDAYRFTDVVITDATTHYTAVRTEPFEVRGDVLMPGFRMRNSQVGGSAFSLDDHWYRRVCSNGLLLAVGGKRLAYRTHRLIDDDQLGALLVIALGKLPERWTASVALLTNAMDAIVEHPDVDVAATLDAGDIPKALIEATQVVALRDEPHTRYGVVQAITLVAHRENSDPDVRFAMERLAGSYLAEA